MKKSLFLVAIATLSLVSCNNSEILESKQDEIKFSVLTDNTSRAVNIYCNNNLPEDFKVWAYWTDDDECDNWYIKEELVSKGANNVYTSTNTRYWPEDTYHLNFIALKNFPSGLFLNDASKVEYGSETVQRNLVSVKENVSEQVDMLYATISDQYKSSDAERGVELNFRHALSQIVFNAKKTNSNLHVVVNGVMVGNAINAAYITAFPESTLMNYVNHDGDVAEDPHNPESMGCITWYTNTPVSPTNFDVIFDEGETVTVGAESISLTSANAAGKEYSNTAMLLIPQTTEAWNPKVCKIAESEGNEGSYLAVHCTIWNVAQGTFNSATDIQLHHGWAYIPVKFEWEQGNKYTYTFVFGNGNGGYDEDGNEVLAPIDYTVTVDDFQPIANQDVEMDIEK